MTRTKSSPATPVGVTSGSGSSGSGTTKGVTSIDRWLGDRKRDVIHFNFGLHDLKRVTESGGEQLSANSQVAKVIEAELKARR